MTEQTHAFMDFLSGRSVEQPVSRRERVDRWVGIRASMTLMPEWARRPTGTWQPALVRRLWLEPSDRLKARLVRWAYPELPCKRMAHERVHGAATSATDRGTLRAWPIAERDLDPARPARRLRAREITFLGQTKLVFVAGRGPAVIVMTEMPGIYAARRALRALGARRRLHRVDAEPVRRRRAGRSSIAATASASIAATACISREFRAFAANASSPVTQWLRALAAHAHPLCGGKGVGAIGMCFTGNFALSMMLEPAMLAPVLSQPSLPLLERGGMHIAPTSSRAVKERLEREDLTVLAYRFEGDSFCRAERFAAYQQALGDRFVGRVLPDSRRQPRRADEEPAQRRHAAPDRPRRRADAPGARRDPRFFRERLVA